MIGCSISFCQSYQIETREQSKQNYYYDAISYLKENLKKKRI